MLARKYLCNAQKKCYCLWHEKFYQNIVKFKPEQELSQCKIGNYTFFVFLVDFYLFSTNVPEFCSFLNVRMPRLIHESSKQRFNYVYLKR